MNSTWSLSPRGFQSSGKDIHTCGPTATLAATLKNNVDTKRMIENGEILAMVI